MKTLKNSFVICEILIELIIIVIAFICCTIFSELWLFLIVYCIYSITICICDFDLSLSFIKDQEMSVNIFLIIFGIPFGTVAGILGLVLQHKNKKGN